jgi:hypothetical protein
MRSKRTYGRGSLQSQVATLQKKLRDALIRCEKQYDGIKAEQLFQKLTEIPPTVLTPLQAVEMAEIISPDNQAMLLRADQRQWAEIDTVQWRDLSKKDKRAARKLTSFLGKGRSHRRQRPNSINYTLALFLIFTLEEILGRPIPFSRSASGGPPRGPAFDALLAALTLAQWRVAIRAETVPTAPGPSALESVLKVTRSERFENLTQRQGLERKPAFATAMSHSLVHTIGMARGRPRAKVSRGTN